jgi:glutamyl-tRNA synthetase
MERLVKLSDVDELTGFFYRDIETEKELLIKKSTPEEVKQQLTETLKVLESLPEFSTENLEIGIRKLQDETQWKKSQYFMLLRVAVTGKTATPPLFETMTIIGKTQVLKRLETALRAVSS